MYEAIRHTADAPLGTVASADFLFDQISQDLLQTGVLLREIHETIVKQRANGVADGELKSRLCALVFLIRKLPREPGVDIGVRATAEAMADLLIEDLANDGARLRARLPALLDELADAGTLMKLDNEYSLQTQESSDWQAEFRNRRGRLANDPASMSSKRAQILGTAVQEAIGSMRLLHGAAKDPRKLLLHFGIDPPPNSGADIPIWIRDGWGAREASVISEARAAGPDSPVIHLFTPKSDADGLARPDRGSKRCGRNAELQGRAFIRRRRRGSPGHGDAAQRGRQQFAGAGGEDYRRSQGHPGWWRRKA